MDDYDEILNFYNDKDRTELSTKLWCNKYLIKLMNAMLTDPGNSHAENCIILVMNLFLTKDPDHYHVKGKKIDSLTQKELKICQKLLKKHLFY